MIVVSILIGACAAPPKPPAEAVAVPQVAPPARPPAPPPVTPVEAEPLAPAAQPALFFTQLMQGPAAAMLVYAEKLRPLGNQELAAEISRLGDPGDTPFTQMQLALALAQTRVPADLARALGLLQRVIGNSSPDAQPLHPLARALASRYAEQRRVEDDRDRQAQLARDAQRRIDQLNDRLEALRAIERSFTRPNNGQAPAPAATPAPAAPGGARPAQ